MKIYPALLLCWVLSGNLVQAQNNKEADSILNLLRTAAPDTNKVHLLLAATDVFENEEPEKAMLYASQAVNLSRQLQYAPLIMKSYRHVAYIYSYRSKFDSALFYNKLTLALALKEKDSFNTGVAYFNIGICYRFLYELDSALDYTLAGARLLDGKGYYSIEGTLNDGLQSLYMTLMQYDKAISYGEKAVAINRKLDDRHQLVNALNNLGLTYVDANRIADAKKVYAEALDIARKIHYVSLEAMILNNAGSVNIREGNYEQALKDAGRSIELGTKMKDEATVINAKSILASCYLYRGNYPEAERMANEVKDAAEKNGFDENKIEALGLLSKIAFASHRYQEGFLYEAEKTKTESAVFNESVKQREAAIRIRFETEKKDNQIKLQRAEIDRKNTYNYILIGGAIVLLILSLLGYRNYNHKQKLQQQRINELETEKKLTATEAVLKGEEQERTRLAKDLHDGLGGMLSGIKYSFANMKGNMIMTPDNAQAFERSMDMLDSSIQEMRRVAHNLMPEALVKFGLDTALKDFCSDISNSSALQVAYQSIGFTDVNVPQTTAITIYRIVQELISNTIRHAGATHAIVQLSKTGGNITLTVEDDGKGFDTSILQQSKGIGWINIKNRIDFIKGKLDVHSQPGKGTSVLVELSA